MPFFNTHMIYLGNKTGNLKGLLPHKTKNKIQEYTFTEHYLLALCDSSGVPDVLCRIFCKNNMLYELWDGFFEDIFSGKSGFIYTVKCPDTGDENLNGGYKSESPYEIISCRFISDINSEINFLINSNKVEVVRFSVLSHEQKGKLYKSVLKTLSRYVLSEENEEIKKFYSNCR